MKLNFSVRAILSFAFFLTTFPPAKARKADIYVSSAGLNDGNTAVLQVNGYSAFSQFRKTPARGLNVAVVDQNNGDFIALSVFDVYGLKSQAVEFQNFIRNLEYGSIVLIAVKDEASQFLNIRSRWIIESLGSRDISHLRYRDSWAMIGRVGASPHSAHEQFSRRFNGSATVHVPDFLLGKTKPNAKYVDINLLSAGLEDGNSAGMLINGRSILDAPTARAPIKFSSTGVHVAVLDSLFGILEDFKSFDVHRSQLANKQLQSFLQSLPYGSIVAIAIRDEGSRFLNRFSRWLLEGLGSRYASILSHRDSWCLVSTVGASPTSAHETYYGRTSGAATLRVRVPLFHRVIPSLTIHIRVFSAGLDSGNIAEIEVNGKSVFQSGLKGIPKGPRRGLNVAVVDETTGRFLQFKTFDVYMSPRYTAAFKDFIRGLQRGRIVLIAVVDEGSKFLDKQARGICEGLGSLLVHHIGHRDSWSMIGSVGAYKGSATEVLRSRHSGPAEVEKEEYPLVR